MKTIRRLKNSVLFVLSLVFLGTSVFAADSASLTILLSVNESAVSSAPLVIYRVGSVNPDAEEVYTSFVEEIEYEEMTPQEDEEIAEKIVEEANFQALESFSVRTDSDGTGEFVNLENGIYLVLLNGIAEDENGVEYEFSPYLVSVPEYADGEWNYDVVSSPGMSDFDTVFQESLSDTKEAEEETEEMLSEDSLEDSGSSGYGGIWLWCAAAAIIAVMAAAGGWTFVREKKKTNASPKNTDSDS